MLFRSSAVGGQGGHGFPEVLDAELHGSRILRLGAIRKQQIIREADKIEHKIIYNYPLTAFEELATNAIVHKEYDTPESVGIYIYKDRISFVNHNRPLPPVTIEALNRDRSFDRRQYLNKEQGFVSAAVGLARLLLPEALRRPAHPRLGHTWRRVPAPPGPCSSF